MQRQLYRELENLRKQIKPIQRKYDAARGELTRLIEERDHWTEVLNDRGAEFMTTHQSNALRKAWKEYAVQARKTEKLEGELSMLRRHEMELMRPTNRRCRKLAV